MPESTSEEMPERTSLQQALQHAQNDKLRNRMAADMKAIQTDSLDHTSNINVQFTSNYEDYMHRGEHPITQAGCSNIKKVAFAIANSDRNENTLQTDLGISCERTPRGFQRTSTDYGARHQSSKVPLGDHVISFDYDADY